MASLVEELLPILELEEDYSMLVSRKILGTMCVWEASRAMLFPKDHLKGYLKDCHKDYHKALPTTTISRRK